MSDTSNPDGASVGPGSEKELDAILEEAAAIVKKISTEVGPADATDGASHEPPLDVTTDVSRDLDAEIAKLDELVAATSRQLDPESTAPPPPPPGAAKSAAGESAQAPAPAKPSKKSAAPAAIPDFMLEFTQTENSQSAPVQPAKSAAPHAAAPPPPAAEAVESATAKPRAGAQAKPGVVGTGMLGVVSKSAEVPPSMPSSPKPSASSAAAGPSAEEPEEAPAVEAPESKGSLVTRTGLPVANILIRALEFVNKPFGFVGDRSRVLLGWVAIATIATASVLYVLSWLR